MCFNITGVAKFAKEMSEKGLGKPKVSLQFELDSSGICNLIKAEVTVDEMVMVKEEVEVDDDVETANTTAEPSNEDVVSEEMEKKADTTSPSSEEAASANATNNETKKEKEKPKKKKKKTKIVEKVRLSLFAFLTQ